MAGEKKQTIKLTPMDIHNQQFKHRGRKGYDRYQVDHFLDQVVEAYGDALDQVVDLKNELVQMRKRIASLQKVANDYQEKKKELDQSLLSAQQAAETIRSSAKQEAHVIAQKAHQQAKVDTDYQRQQQKVLARDYRRLKQQVSFYRSHLQKMLQQEIDNLNDDSWQKALDKYFKTPRFYPEDGSEPVPSVNKNKRYVQDGKESSKANLVDKMDSDDVNSSQVVHPEKRKTRLRRDQEQKHVQATKVRMKRQPKIRKTSGTTIIFPRESKKSD